MPSNTEFPHLPADRRTVQPRRIGALAVAVALALSACSPFASEPADAPAASVLGPGVRLGPVELRTGNLDALHSFYSDGVGLDTISTSDTEVVLGLDDEGILRLVASDSPADDATQAGLYHTAFLYPDGAELASALARTATVFPSSFQGSADHSVSEAFYFGDPDGNGVELYLDRPADTWQWRDGLVTMGSDALDPNAFITDHLGSAAPAAGAAGISLGHLHLRGGDLGRAEDFYGTTLGFAVTARSEGALFLSANGYHHHLAVNTWSSAGASARPQSRGLGSITVLVPDRTELDAVTDRIATAGLRMTTTEDALIVADPWGTSIEVRIAD
jgi:catechol 2,3-dioxygenase